MCRKLLSHDPHCFLFSVPASVLCRTQTESFYTDWHFIIWILSLDVWPIIAVHRVLHWSQLLELIRICSVAGRGICCSSCSVFQQCNDRTLNKYWVPNRSKTDWLPKALRQQSSPEQRDFMSDVRAAEKLSPAHCAQATSGIVIWPDNTYILKCGSSSQKLLTTDIPKLLCLLNVRTEKPVPVEAAKWKWCGCRQWKDLGMADGDCKSPSQHLFASSNTGCLQKLCSQNWVGSKMSEVMKSRPAVTKL